MNRKSFEKLSGEDNPHFSGGSISYLIRENVDKDNWPMLIQLVFKILYDNLKS